MTKKLKSVNDVRNNMIANIFRCGRMVQMDNMDCSMLLDDLGITHTSSRNTSNTLLDPSFETSCKPDLLNTLAYTSSLAGLLLTTLSDDFDGAIPT